MHIVIIAIIFLNIYLVVSFNIQLSMHACICVYICMHIHAHLCLHPLINMCQLLLANSSICKSFYNSQQVHSTEGCVIYCIGGKF